MKGRIASLDGLRALSIAFVFLAHLYHSHGYPDNPATFWMHFYLGRFGVQVFFVISGFLITTLLLREADRFGGVSLRGFFTRRSFRILPAAYAYMFAIAMVCTWSGHPLPTWDLIAAVTYTISYVPNVTTLVHHLWSLSVEEQFYLLWPFAFVHLPRFRKQACWLVVAVAPLARIAYMHWRPDQMDQAFPAVADYLAFGCLLALYSPLQLPKWVYSTPATLSLCGATVLSAGLVPGRNPIIWGVTPLLIAASIHVLVEREDWVLNNVGIMRVGYLSYALYLCQAPFLSGARGHWWTAFPTNVFLSIFAALTLHNLVEQPMLRIGRGVLRKTGLHGVPQNVAISGQVGS